MSRRCRKRDRENRERRRRLLRAVFASSIVVENAPRIAGRARVTKYAMLGALLLSCTSALAQSADKEPKEVAVVRDRGRNQLEHYVGRIECRTHGGCRGHTHREVA